VTGRFLFFLTLGKLANEENGALLDANLGLPALGFVRNAPGTEWLKMSSLEGPTGVAYSYNGWFKRDNTKRCDGFRATILLPGTYESNKLLRIAHNRLKRGMT